MKLLRRLIPPLRLGGMSFDMSVIVLLIMHLDPAGDRRLAGGRIRPQRRRSPAVAAVRTRTAAAR